METLVGIVILSLLIAITFVVINNVRHAKRVERTLSAVYILKEEVKKTLRVQGSYTKGRMMPLLFAAGAFPSTLDIDYERQLVETPMGHPLDVTGRNRHFSIDLYGLSPEDCYDFGNQIIHGNYLMLGNHNDDFEVLQIGKMSFSDNKPLTPNDLEKACTQSFSIDVIMAFR